MPLTRLKYWFLATRPKTLSAGVAPVIVGLCLANPYTSVSNLYALITIICSLLIQIGTNYANDYYDFKKGADTSLRKGPMRMAQSGHINPTHLKWGSIGVFAMAFLLGLALVYKGGLPILAIGIISIICGFLYTAGPLALAYIGLGDIFALIFFGPVAVGGTYYIQMGSISWPVIIVGLGIGLLSTALISVNNIRDFEEDTHSNKKTLIVRFGKNFGYFEYSLCLCLSNIILITHTYQRPIAWAALIPYSLLSLHLAYKLLANKAPLNSILAQTGFLITCYAIIILLTYSYPLL